MYQKLGIWHECKCFLPKDTQREKHSQVKLWLTTIMNMESWVVGTLFFLFFIYLFFCTIWIFFHEDSQFTGQKGKRKGISFNSFLPLPPALQTLIHQPGVYCKELTSAHSQQPESNREPLVAKRKSLTTKLAAFKSSLYKRFLN